MCAVLDMSMNTVDTKPKDTIHLILSADSSWFHETIVLVSTCLDRLIYEETTDSEDRSKPSEIVVEEDVKENKSIETIKRIGYEMKKERIRLFTHVVSQMIYEIYVEIPFPSTLNSLIRNLAEDGNWNERLSWLLYRILSIASISERRYMLLRAVLDSLNQIVRLDGWRPSSKKRRSDLCEVLRSWIESDDKYISNNTRALLESLDMDSRKRA